PPRSRRRLAPPPGGEPGWPPDLSINEWEEFFVMQGFRKFVLRGNVVDLAVAVVIGAAFGSVVQALVKDLITPLIGAFGGVPDFASLFFTINGSKFLIGEFINSLVSFVLLAAVIYWFVVLPVSKLLER